MAVEMIVISNSRTRAEPEMTDKYGTLSNKGVVLIVQLGNGDTVVKKI